MRKILPAGGANFQSRIKSQAELDLLHEAAELLAKETGADVTNAQLLGHVLREFLARKHDNLSARPQM